MHVGGAANRSEACIKAVWSDAFADRYGIFIHTQTVHGCVLSHWILGCAGGMAKCLSVSRKEAASEIHS